MNKTAARDLLRQFEFKGLFLNELGWDDHNGSLPLKAGEVTVTLTAVAEKRGMAAYLCTMPGPGQVYDYQTRCRIEIQLAKSVREHLVIYADPNRRFQTWQWVKREPGKPIARREHTYTTGQSGEALLQKLEALEVKIEEDEQLTLVGITARARQAFDVDRVTKRFYDRFKTEHAAFLKQIEGIDDEDEQEWYASIMLNPPYVELNALEGYKVRGYQCFDSGNLYALVLERCAVLGRDDARQGFIVPVSSVSTERYASLQGMLRKRDDVFSSFDDRPARLFDGLEHIRLTIHLIGRPSPEPRLHSTRYNKWATEARSCLFDTLTLVQTRPCLVDGTIPKLSANCEQSILRKLTAQRKQLCSFFSTTAAHHVFYSRKVGYFLQVLDFEPLVLDGEGRKRPPSEFKTVTFANEESAKLALCALNSSLFYWFVTVFSDCRHVNKREVDAFPLDLAALTSSPRSDALIRDGAELMKDLRRHAVKKTMRFQHDTLTVECIYPKHSKSIIDSIDQTLAEHYGFTDEELDFIINYDIKYRMGRDGGEAEEE